MCAIVESKHVPHRRWCSGGDIANTVCRSRELGRIEKQFPVLYEQPFTDAVAVTTIVAGRWAILTVTSGLVASATTAGVNAVT